MHFSVFEGDLCESSKLCNDHPSDHAPDCPKTQYNRAMDSPHGAVIHRSIDILNLLEAGISFGLDDLTGEEARAIVFMKSELQKKSESKSDKES